MLNHIVGKNETLKSISYEYYGVDSLYKDIALVNSIPKPFKIRPDQVLKLPDSIPYGTTDKLGKYNRWSITFHPNLSEKWFPSSERSHFTKPVTRGNIVTALIDGRDTYAAMVHSLSLLGPGDYVYLAGWWLSIDFMLIPGKKATTIRHLFNKLDDKGVQIRVMLWDYTAKTQNTLEVKYINSLSNGSGVLDSKYVVGAHHQKILIVYNKIMGLQAYCGGVDINEDRIYSIKRQIGSPMHDVHCNIKGPAAFDLLRTFIERWMDHPEHEKLDSEKGTLIGLSTNRPTPVQFSLSEKSFVRIGRTYNRKCGYSFASKGEFSILDTLKHALKTAERYIYIEDQYLVAMEISDLLVKSLKKISHLTILIPEKSDLPQYRYRRQAFIRTKGRRYFIALYQGTVVVY